MKKFHRTPLASAVSAAITGSVLATFVSMPAHAQNNVLEEIIVTAQKRTENLQDVPVSIDVLSNQQLEDLNVNSFNDYIKFLPTVSYTSNGPGYAKLYMRGISSGGDGNHSGSMPSVGVYLDEQPITTINQVLDLHIYDIARIETLAGPQGTLFGQGSQAGTLRIITNKPDLQEFDAGYDIFADTVAHGSPGYGAEGFVNIPINDRSAVRLVGWHEYDGGYIDNVPGTINYVGSGITRDNAALVEDDYNDVETTGARAQLKFDINDSWTATPGIIYQKAEAHGLWQHNPEDLGELEVQRFFPDWQDEDWYQATVTLEGKVGDLDLVYAGSYLDRNVDSEYDYSGYAEYLESFGYCYYYDAEGGCLDPSQYVHGKENFNRRSHELRLQSSSEERFRWIVGAFFQRQVHDFDLQWIVPAMLSSDSVIENGHTTWQTYQIRQDRDDAYFGEASFDFNDKLTGTVGIRHFKYENSLYGFNGFIGHCTGFYDDDGNFVEDRVDGTPQYPCFDTRILDDVSDGTGNSYKASLSYHLDDNKLVYATYSEGFRAGGVNRARVPGIPKYEPDWVYNHEIGWKTDWLGSRLRFNGAVYMLDWEDFQYGFLDFAVSNLTIIGNVGQARTWGSEFDLSYAATDALTLSFSGSYNDAKLREPYWRSDIERDDGVPARAPKDTRMPYVPKTQFTALGRYNFEFHNLPFYAQGALAYTGETWNDLEVAIRLKQDSYTLVNLSTGIQTETWSVDLFVDNVTDERAQVDRLNPGYASTLDSRTAVNRPRSISLRYGYRF